MEKYIKKVFIFTVGKILIFILCYSLFFLKDDYILLFTFNTFHILDLTGLIFYSFFDIGLIMLVCKITNIDFYKSNKKIFFLAIIFQSRIGFEILIFNPSNENASFLILLSYLYLFFITITFNYLWGYYREITSLVSFTNLVIFHLIFNRAKDFFDIIFEQFGIFSVSNITKGIVLSSFIILITTIYFFIKKYNLEKGNIKQARNHT